MTSSRGNLGRHLGLLALDVGNLALAVDYLDASLLQLGNRVPLHLGPRRQRLLGGAVCRRRSRRSSVCAAGLAHALLGAAAAAQLVLARHLLSCEGQAAAGDNLAPRGVVAAGLVDLLGGHAAALAGDGRGSGGLGVFHGDGGDIGDDGDGWRAGLGPVVPAAEGVEPGRDVLPQGRNLLFLALQLLVRLADVRVRVGVLDVLLLVHLGKALAGLAVVKLNHAAARPVGHGVGVWPPAQDLVKLLGQDPPLDHVFDALRHLWGDDGDGLADMLKVEILLQERVEGPVGGGGFSRESPFALGNRRRLQLAHLLRQLGLPPLVSAHIGHGSVDVLFGRRLRLETDTFLWLAAFALSGRRRKEFFVVDAVCVEIHAFVVHGLVVHSLIFTVAFRRVKGHVAERWAILLLIVVLFSAIIVL
ncbi:hypothetical protein Trco_006516 [Trichoderma cornu-damae]|uniref:Uncharacterized protein n=1 Tax=Trichoderma cornu-damae TaxID=654480 RepID=A0A9P8TV35_9HYPO|nr:hypothetical protein Trco_006516 [Trichoderma cornu-damae]